MKHLAPCSIFLVLLAAVVAPSASALEVLGTDPARYALGIPPGLPIIAITFDGVPELPSGEAVRVAGTISGLHHGTLEPDGADLRFHVQDGPFHPGEMVLVNYRRDIATAGGDSLTGGFHFAFTIASGSGSAVFEESGLYPTQSVPYFIYGGDLDGDDTPDLAVPNEGTNDVSIFLNAQGNGSFPFHDDYSVGQVPSSIFGEDFDNDGDQDLATADIASSTVTVLLNRGDGTFAKGITYPAGNRCRQIHGGDFDGDNDVDLCSTSNLTHQVYLFRNNGNGTFTADPPYGDVQRGPFAIRTGDFDGDGHLDIGVACQQADSLTVLTNTGTGGFSTTSRHRIGNGPWCLNGNDLDGDHDFDLVSVASYEDRFAVLLNDGTGAFSDLDSYPTGGFPLGVFAADLDGDGDVDATSSNYGGASVDLFLNAGDGTMTHHATLPTTASGSYTWAHDLDGDGDLDLSVVDENADLLYVFLQAPSPSGAGASIESRPPAIRVWPNPLATMTSATVALHGPIGSRALDLFGVDGRLIRRIWSRGTVTEHVPLEARIALPAEWMGPGVFYLRLDGAEGGTAATRIVVTPPDR